LLQEMNTTVIKIGARIWNCFFIWFKCL